MLFSGICKQFFHFIRKKHQITIFLLKMLAYVQNYLYFCKSFLRIFAYFNILGI